MREMNTKFNVLPRQTNGAAISPGDLATDGGDYPTGLSDVRARTVLLAGGDCTRIAAGSLAAMAMEG
jgi:hypothetical protein